uniref:Uncharacterized protein n=1 Tax=Rhizophora mucronata TaxID=61149 RepID=A0A2P2Q8U5_RHIMU
MGPQDNRRQWVYYLCLLSIISRNKLT